LTTAGQPTRLPHNRDPDLADILDLLLKVKAAGITLVAASGRHEHEWKLWRDRRLPEGRTLIVGVIDHTSNIIEHSEAVADRIVRWARVVGRENVIAGVDCGFDPEQKRWPARRPSLRATAANRDIWVHTQADHFLLLFAGEAIPKPPPFGAVGPHKQM
jgi:methionine synthase II (cobalamin-independent)